MFPVGFEPTISAGEQPQTHALDHAATGIGIGYVYIILVYIYVQMSTTDFWPEWCVHTLLPTTTHGKICYTQYY